MFGVDNILSKCQNYYLALSLSESVTVTLLISVTLGNLQTTNVLTRTVLETSLLSMPRDERVLRTSSFEICIKL